MGQKWAKLGKNWGMLHITRIARADFLVFPLVIMSSVCAYVTLHESGGTFYCALNLEPRWAVFPIFPRKTLICPQANARISLVWYGNSEKYPWIIFYQNQCQDEVTTWFIPYKTLYTTHNIPYQTYSTVNAHILSFSRLMHIKHGKWNTCVIFRYHS